MQILAAIKNSIPFGVELEVNVDKTVMIVMWLGHSKSLHIIFKLYFTMLKSQKGIK